MQRLVSSRPVAALLALVFLTLAVWFGWNALHGPAPSTDPMLQTAKEDEQPNTAPAAQPAPDDTELRPQTAAERARAPRQPAVLKTTSRASVAGQPAAAENRPEPSPYTRQLVSSLTSLDLGHGPVTPEQAEQWKKTLQSLTSQGAAAIPAIREFLDQNREVTFGAAGGELGQSSLRSAFINALGQIGGPEGTAAMVQTLQSTTLPSEIAQLSQILEQQAPGQYHQETISAITEVLNMASGGQLPAGWDVGTLFKVLQSYGGPATASALEQLQGPWKYYATMSLAGLPNGEGISVLANEVQDTSTGGKRDFAYQMLAQNAAQYQDASTALLQQAKANQIPDTAWAKIATGLAGDQYQIGEAPPVPDGTAAQPGLKTYHIASGNQNFYSLPLGADPQLVQSRLALIDQLLGATSSPVGVAALQSARATLSGTIAGK